MPIVSMNSSTGTPLSTWIFLKYCSAITGFSPDVSRVLCCGAPWLRATDAPPQETKRPLPLQLQPRALFRAARVGPPYSRLSMNEDAHEHFGMPTGAPAATRGKERIEIS